jgi:replicative DNA helicase
VENNIENLPSDIDAEKSVLGAMLMSSDAMAEVTQVLKPKHFFYAPHQIILDQIYKLYQKGISAEPISLIDTLKKQKLDSNIGGEVYITELLDSVSTTSNVLYWANIVHEKYIQRQLIEKGRQIEQLGHLENAGDATEALNLAQQSLFTLANEDQRSESERLGEGVQKFLQDLDSMRKNDNVLGVKTGFTSLDNKIHGFANGQMIVIGARPGVGKTAIAVDIARNASIKKEHSVYMISLEMSKEELYSRILSAEAGVNHNRFLEPRRLSNSEWEKLNITRKKIENADLFIESPPGITIPEIRSKARQLKHTHGLELLIIDYLGLINAIDSSLPRVQIISDFTRDLKLLAKDLNIPIVLLSQLNRESEKRATFSAPESNVDRSIPKMSELRESGSIEQDADVVLLLHRAMIPGSEDESYSNDARLIIAKNRRGSQGVVFLTFQGDFVRFVESGSTANFGTPPSDIA